MELEKLDGFNEDGIPVKQLQNKFFVTSSKLLHSRMSLDTRRRVQEAAALNTNSGTFIMRQGPYETRYERALYIYGTRDSWWVFEVVGLRSIASAGNNIKDPQINLMVVVSYGMDRSLLLEAISIRVAFIHVELVFI